MRKPTVSITKQALKWTPQGSRHRGRPKKHLEKKSRQGAEHSEGESDGAGSEDAPVDDVGNYYTVCSRSTIGLLRGFSISTTSWTTALRITLLCCHYVSFSKTNAVDVSVRLHLYKTTPRTWQRHLRRRNNDDDRTTTQFQRFNFPTSFTKIVSSHPLHISHRVF